MTVISLAPHLLAENHPVAVFVIAGFVLSFLCPLLAISGLASCRSMWSMPAFSKWRRVRHSLKRLNTRKNSSKFTDVSQSFRFFDLPGELRVRIYNELLIEEKCYPNDAGLKICAKKILDLNMLLVSHKFGEEYLHEAELQSVLLLEDSARFGWTPISLPPGLHYVQKVEVHIRLLCLPKCHLEPDPQCFVAKELRNHRNRLQNLATILPSLKSLTINAYLDPRSNCVDCQCTLLDRRTALTTLDDLTAFYVYETYTDKCWIKQCEHVFHSPKKLLMEFNSTTDALHEVGDDKVSGEYALAQEVGNEVNLAGHLR